MKAVVKGRRHRPLLFVLFTTNVVLAHAAETNLGSATHRRGAPRLNFFARPPERANFANFQRYFIGGDLFAHADDAVKSSTSLLPLIRALSEDVGSVRKLFLLRTRMDASSSTSKTFTATVRPNQYWENCPRIDQSKNRWTWWRWKARLGDGFSWYRAYPHQTQ